jgi:alanyl-tRNA synthetase
VVEVGDFSRELCGGTHVGHGSQVGPVHVLGEASIGANLRRIEALTGLEALHYADRERQLLAEVAALLKTRPEDAPEQLRRRLEALATAQRELEKLRVAGLERLAGDLAGRVDRSDGGWLLAERVPEAGADDLRRIASAVRDRVGTGPGVVVLGSEVDGKAAMVALLTADLAGAGAAARDVLARAAKAVGGGAGGKGDLASAGGRDPSQLAEALRIARDDAMAVLAGGSGKGTMG